MIKKYPFVKQNDLKDCGVASLLMIIRYYKGNISLEKLREMTKTTKIGTSAYHLVEAAKEIGFKTEAIKLKLDEFKEDKICLPCIAYVTIDKIYNHFLVIYKIDYKNKKILIADPATKIRYYSFHEFKKIYNDILIILYPKKKIPTITKQKSYFKFLLSLFKYNKNSFIFIIVLSFFITLFSLLSTFFFELSLNSINNLPLYYKIFCIFLIFALIKNIILFIRNQILVFVNKKITFKLFMNVYKKIILLPYNYYRNRTSGEVITRINDLNTVRSTLNEMIIGLFIDLILVLTSGIILFILNKKIFIFSLIIVSLYIIHILIFKPKIHSNLNSTKNSYSDINSYMVENLIGFETVKGLGIEKTIIDNVNFKLKNFLNKNSKLEFINNLEQTLVSLISDISFLILIYIGFVLIKNNLIETSLLISLTYIFNYFTEPIKNILNLVIQVEESKISYERISEIIDYDIKVKKDKNIKFNSIKIKPCSNINSFDSFLKNKEIEISKGEKIALIGKSGSGKSTLLKLIKNYYGVNNVVVDDKNINNLSYNDINKNITYVSQNEILFTDTLYNNIALNEEIDSDLFYQVIKDCHIEEIIKNNNLNYYMLIEENGFNISGGEKQRIVLARSLIKKKDYLLLDESLSQVDVDLERKILKNIIKHKYFKTIIFVTHRKDNLDLFDRVIKMDDGQVIDDITRRKE